MGMGHLFWVHGDPSSLYPILVMSRGRRGVTRPCMIKRGGGAGVIFLAGGGGTGSLKGRYPLPNFCLCFSERSVLKFSLTSPCF